MERREHPILYSTPMVLAKLAGRKTQTRRIIKESFNGCLTNGGPHPCPNDPVVYHPGEQYIDPTDPGDNRKITIDYPQVRADFFCSTLNSTAKCPYGKVGDWLWCRETFGYEFGGGYLYKASHEHMKDVGGLTDHKWKPSIFMPKEAARIWEEVTDIRVETLHQITYDDCIAEGIEDKIGHNADIAYKRLWESIHGKGSWDINPWVWVLTTKVLSINGRP